MSKQLVSVTNNGDGTYTLVYEYLVTNYGGTPLHGVQIEEDLSVAFPEPAMCEIRSVTSSTLHVNEAFDGTGNTGLLSGEDSLDLGQSGHVTLTVCILRETGVSSYSNSAIVSARDSGDSLIVDTSQRGDDPDPDGDGDPRNNSRATVVTFAEFEQGGALETTITVSELDGIAVDTIALSAFLSVDGFTAQLNTSFRNTGMDTFGLAANGTVGNIRVNSSLVFDPSSLSFASLQGGAAFTLLDLDVASTVFIAVPQTASYAQFAVSSSLDGISAQGTLRMGICPLEFWALNACGTWDWTACDTAINGCALFTADDGFSSATLSVSELLLWEDIFGLQGLLNAVLSFTPDQKAFEPSLRIVPDWEICVGIELLGEVSVSSFPLSVFGTLIYGIVGECTLDNGVTFTFAESLSEAKNSSVTGKAGYWEVLKVSGPLPSCCDDPGGVEIAAYFGGSPPPPAALFGVGLVTASFDYHFVQGFGVSFDAEYPLNGDGWTLAFTLSITW